MKKILGSTFGAIFIAWSAPALAQGDAAPIAPAIAPAAKPTPVDLASLALAHQILTIAFPPDKRSQMFDSRMDSLIDLTRKSMENAGVTKDQEFQAILDRSTQRMFEQMKLTIGAALPDYFESMARAYARTFSPDDLNAILAFVKTPAGQHYFERASLIIKDPDMQAATQRMMAQLVGKLPEITRQNKQDIADYLARKAKKAKPAAAKPVT